MTQPLSQRLRKAATEKMLLSPGLQVTVYNERGKVMVKGHIREVDPDVGIVRVQDDFSGADLQVDVDPTRYDLQVHAPGEPTVRHPAQVTLYVRPSRPGPHRGGTI
jgi:hypothetical protein